MTGRLPPCAERAVIRVTPRRSRGAVIISFVITMGVQS